MTTKNTAINTAKNTARRGADPIRVQGLTLAWGGVDSRPIRRWRRLFAALLVVLGATVAAPEQAAAQTETTFISNTGQTSAGSSNWLRATAFTTGAGTYTLPSVALTVGSSHIGTPTPVVQIYRNNSGTPGTLVATMTNPGTLVNNAVNVFTAPANTTLAASTTYWVTTSNSATTDGNGFRVGLTSSTQLDSGTAAEWSMGNARWRTSSAETWDTTSSRLQFQIRGTEGTTTPTPTNNAPVVANVIPDQTATVNGILLRDYFSDFPDFSVKY